MLLFLESYDHYITLADKQRKGWANGTGSVGAFGRNGTNGVRYSSNNGGDRWPLPAPLGSLVVGTGWRFGTLTSANINIFEFEEAAGIPHIFVLANSVGNIEVRRASIGGTLLATGTATLVANVYYFIEVKLTVHDTTGSVVVKVNGVTDVNISGVDTRNGNTGVVNFVGNCTNGPGNGGSWDYDDLYICDTTGSVNNDFLGDGRVQCALPSGNGNSSQLVGSDGNSTDNYALVDESAPNDDTDYVESSTVGDKDTYAFGDLTPTTGSIAGIQIIPYARKTDAGTRSIVTVARSGGTEVDSSSKALTTTYAFHRDIRETKPGGGAWTISTFNGAEFGVKVDA